MGFPSLETFKIQLDVALSNLIWHSIWHSPERWVGPPESKLYYGAVIFYLGESYLANPQQHVTAECKLLNPPLFDLQDWSQWGITRWTQLWRDLVSRDLWQLTTFLAQPTWHFIFFYPVPANPCAQCSSSPLCCTESEIKNSKLC